jgi:phage shock protein PspC (stress-responsive transcriptional regulator)
MPTNTAPPQAEPPAPPPAPTGASGPSGTGSGFFDWIRSLGVARTPGWIGGVASGVAARLGIDPLIVRGVLVVFALFGAPAFLAYGTAWLLLPDTTGRIHLERAVRGTWDNALVGIGIFLLVGLLPWGWSSTPWSPFGWNGLGFNPLNPLGIDLGPVIWTLLLLGVVAATIVWAVRRSRDGRAADTRSHTAYAPGESDVSGAADVPAAHGSGSGADANADADVVAEPAPPAPPGPGTDTADYDTWKAQHDAWRVEHEEWKRSQADANRAARAGVHAEQRARAAAFAARAEEARRERRRTRPRTSFAYVVATMGAALGLGAIAALLALASPGQEAWAGTIGLALASLVVALAMVLAGALRRRSGFLAFLTVVLLLTTAGSAAVPRPAVLLLGSITGPVRSATLVQPVGDVSLTLSAPALDGPIAPRMEIVQGAGSVWVEVHDGTRLGLDIACGSCSVQLARVVDDEFAYYDGIQLEGATGAAATRVIGSGPDTGTTDATLTIRAGATRITVVEYVEPGTNTEEN